MVFCQECGSENIDDAKFCSSCGNEIVNKNERVKINNWTGKSVDEQKEKLLRRGIKRINLFAIFSGVITWVVVIFLFARVYPNVTEDSTIALFFIVAQVISGIVSGYIGNTSYKNGIINGGILCIIPTILLAVYNGLYGLIVGFFLFLCFGILGGVIGCFVKNKII